MDAILSNGFYSSLFIILGFVLLFLEVFIPSGGILGICAVASTALGTWGLWSQGHTFTASLLIAGFVGYGAGMLYWIMRRVSLRGSMSPESSTSVDERIEQSLVGREGVTATELRPAGTAIIDGRRVDVVSVGDFISKDERVRIVDITGNRVVVRRAPSTSGESKDTAGTAG